MFNLESLVNKRNRLFTWRWHPLPTFGHGSAWHFRYIDCSRWSFNSTNFLYEAKFGSCCHVTTFERTTNSISDVLCAISWTLIGGCQIKEIWQLHPRWFRKVCLLCMAPWLYGIPLYVLEQKVEIKGNSISSAKFLMLSICCRLES